MLASLPPPVVVADAVALPVANHRANAVLAMHMLYHVPDLQAALTEAVRVLTPGGIMIASTNARGDKKELDDLWAAAAAEVLNVDRGPQRISLSNRFALDDAPDLLSPYFTDIEVLELSSVITVDRPDPVIGTSARTAHGPISWACPSTSAETTKRFHLALIPARKQRLGST